MNEPSTSVTLTSTPITFGPTHPVTRLGRVTQQLVSFAKMHGSELEALAAQIEADGLGEHAARIRIFRDLHAEEAQMVLDEVTRVRAVLVTEAEGAASRTAESAQDLPPSPAAAPQAAAERDPAGNSPRRARWLAEEARKSAERARPKSRRELLRPRLQPPD